MATTNKPTNQTKPTSLVLASDRICIYINIYMCTHRHTQTYTDTHKHTNKGRTSWRAAWRGKDTPSSMNARGSCIIQGVCVCVCVCMNARGSCVTQKVVFFLVFPVYSIFKKKNGTCGLYSPGPGTLSCSFCVCVCVCVCVKVGRSGSAGGQSWD